MHEAEAERVWQFWFAGDAEQNYKAKWFPSSGVEAQARLCAHPVRGALMRTGPAPSSPTQRGLIRARGSVRLPP